MITPAELERHHRRLSQGGGLESRLLFCMSAPASDIDPFAAETADFSDLIDRLRMALELSRSGVLEQTDPISRAVFLERGTGWQPSTVLALHDKVTAEWGTLVRERLPRAESEDVAALWARGEVQVVRLAAAYAVSSGSDVVSPEHVRAAVAAWRYCAESAETFLGIAAGQGDGRADRVQVRKLLTFLHQRQGWTSATDINKLFGGNTRGTDLTAVLGYLLGKRHIERRMVGTSGRTRTEYRLIPLGSRKNGKSL